MPTVTLSTITRHLSLVLSLLCALPVVEAAGGASPRALERATAAQKPKLARRESSDTKKQLMRQRALEASVKAGPLKPSMDQSHRSNFPDPKLRATAKRPGAYPWHFDITATYFYIGELPTKNNPTPNTASSWDSAWDDNYGGFDDPNPAHRCPRTYAPLAFTPQLNPFYVALPYNDSAAHAPRTNPTRERVSTSRRPCATTWASRAAPLPCTGALWISRSYPAAPGLDMAKIIPS